MAWGIKNPVLSSIGYEKAKFFQYFPGPTFVSSTFQYFQYFPVLVAALFGGTKSFRKIEFCHFWVIIDIQCPQLKLKSKNSNHYSMKNKTKIRPIFWKNQTSLSKQTHETEQYLLNKADNWSKYHFSVEATMSSKTQHTKVQTISPASKINFGTSKNKNLEVFRRNHCIKYFFADWKFQKQAYFQN